MMKRIMRYSPAGCALALAMLVSSTGFAGTLSYFEDFEGLTAGADLIGQDGWIEFSAGRPGHLVSATSGFSGNGIVDVSPAPLFQFRAISQRPHGLDFAGLVNGDVVDFSAKVKHGSDYTQVALGRAGVDAHFISIEAAGVLHRMETSGGGTINTVGTREDNVWVEFALKWTIGGDAVFTVTRLSDNVELTTMALDTALLIPDPSVGDAINLWSSPHSPYNPNSGNTQFDDISLSITKIPQPGDHDGDGDVDGNDFLWHQISDPGAINTNWGPNYGVAALSGVAAVPEPSTLSLCALAAFALWPTRRQRV